MAMLKPDDASFEAVAKTLSESFSKLGNIAMLMGDALLAFGDSVGQLTFCLGGGGAGGSDLPASTLVGGGAGAGAGTNFGSGSLGPEWQVFSPDLEFFEAMTPRAQRSAPVVVERQVASLDRNARRIQLED